MAESKTRVIYEFKRPIGDFEAYKLLGDEPGGGCCGPTHATLTRLAKAAMN